MRSPMEFAGVFYDLSQWNGKFDELFVTPFVANRGSLKGALAPLKQIADWPVLDALHQEHKKISCPEILAWGENAPTFHFPMRKKCRQVFLKAANTAPEQSVTYQVAG